MELLKAPIPLGPEVLVSHANAALSTVHFVVRTPTGTIRRMPEIEKVTLTSRVRVRDVPHNPTADGFDSLRPRQAVGRRSSTSSSGGPPRAPEPARGAAAVLIGEPAEGWPSSWSPRAVEGISHEGLRVLLHKRGVPDLQASRRRRSSR